MSLFDDRDAAANAGGAGDGDVAGAGEVNSDATGLMSSDREQLQAEVVDELSVLAGELNVLQSRLVDVVARVIEDDLWSDDGYRSVAHWLTIQLGISPGHARQLEATARRMGEFPLTGDRFREGRLSHDQVNALVTEAPSFADVYACELVEHATVSQIRRIVRTEFPHGPEPSPVTDHVDTVDGDEPVDTESSPVDHAADGDADVDGDADGDGDDGLSVFDERFSFGWTPDGRFTGSFDLSAPSGMVLDAVLQEARDALFRDGNRDVGWPDALVEIARRATGAAPSGRVERFKHVLYVDTTKIIDGLDPITRLVNGTIVPPAVADYLSCDGTCQPIWMQDCLPLGVGTTTRTIPERLRRYIAHRDQGCRVPGCGAKAVEIHHIAHWEDGGVTESRNLVSLCAAHHRMHHANRLGITGNPDDHTLAFTNREGQPLQFWPKPTPPPVTGDAKTPTAANTPPGTVGPPGDGPQQSCPRYRHPTGERLHLRWLSQWEPLNDRQHLGASEARAWEEHHRRHRRLADPEPS